MNDDTQDDRTDAAIRDAAQSYNVPPATPRDEMWARIQARRAAPARRGATSVRWAWASAAAAAVLLVGIGIGYTLRGPRSVGTPTEQVAVRTGAGAPAAPTVAPSAPADTGVAPRRVGREREPQIASRLPNRREPRNGSDSATPTDLAPDLAYRLAVAEHLARTEALLTSFRAEARSGTVDAQIGGWARDLLRTTRLMESSTENQDPTMRRLFGDLELVLVQIAQYSATAQGQQRGEELDLIEQSIDRRGVLGKLRAAIPPGMVPAGT